MPVRVQSAYLAVLLVAGFGLAAYAESVPPAHEGLMSTPLSAAVVKPGHVLDLGGGVLRSPRGPAEGGGRSASR